MDECIINRSLRTNFKKTIVYLLNEQIVKNASISTVNLPTYSSYPKIKDFHVWFTTVSFTPSAEPKFYKYHLFIFQEGVSFFKLPFKEKPQLKIINLFKDIKTKISRLFLLIRWFRRYGYECRFYNFLPFLTFFLLL